MTHSAVDSPRMHMAMKFVRYVVLGIQCRHTYVCIYVRRSYLSKYICVCICACLRGCILALIAIMVLLDLEMAVLSSDSCLSTGTYILHTFLLCCCQFIHSVSCLYARVHVYSMWIHTRISASDVYGDADPICHSYRNLRMSVHTRLSLLRFTFSFRICV